MDFYWKWGVWIGNEGFGASQFGLRFGAALPGDFFGEKHLFFVKNMFFDDFQMIFHQNGPNLLLTRGTTIKTGILTLFWWVP